MKLIKIEIVRRWNSLTIREQLLAGGTIVILIFYGFYSGIILPLSIEKQKIHRKIIAQQEIYQYLSSLSEEVKALRNAQQATQTDSTENEALISKVDATSVQLKIKPAINKIIPEGNSKVIVWLDAVPFDQLFYWIIELEKKHAISVSKISLIQDEVKVGFVKANIDLNAINK